MAGGDRRGGMEGFLRSLEGDGQGRQCTAIWTAGAFAYRCKTCQINDSSALCVECFQAGDHTGHDYVLYLSEAGGCCDCGDPISLKDSGFCPRHRCRHAGGSRGLGRAAEGVVRGVAGAVLLRIVLAMARIALGAPPAGPDPAPDPPDPEFEQWVARKLVKWVDRLNGVGAIRDIVCAEAGRGLAARHDLCAAYADVYDSSAALAGSLTTLAHAWEQLKGCLRGEFEARGRAGEVPLSVSDGILSLFSGQSIAMMTDATTMLMLMLYEHSFKYSFTCLLLEHYRKLGAPELLAGPQGGGGLRSPEPQKTIRASLDRMTVQLFNSPEITLKLAREHGLLDTFFGLLGDILRGTMGPDDTMVSPEHDLVKEKSYHRVVGDLCMVLIHPNVAMYILTERPLLLENFLASLALAQGMNPYVCKTGEHVERESFAWTYSVTLEVQLMRLYAQMLTLSDGAPVTDAVALTLVQAAMATLQATADWCKLWAEVNNETPDSLWGSMLRGDLDVSVHLPLHRATGVAIGFLLEASLGPGGAPSPLGIFLSKDKAKQNLTSVVLPAVAALAWFAQVRARLWVRNGDEVLRIEHVYRCSFWYDTGMDLDLLLLRCWSAVAHPQDVVGTVLRPFGAGPLLDFEGKAPFAPIEPQRMGCINEGLRLLVFTLRNRSDLWSEEEKLRREIIHRLCVKAKQTHSQIVRALSLKLSSHPLLEQVLEEVSIYHAPKLQEHGQYSLKDEYWKDFDPFFHHYSREQLEAALERSVDSGAWKPEWQLAPPAPGAEPLEANAAVLASPAMHQLMWAVLRYSVQHPESSSSEWILAVCQLLSLALHRNAEAQAQYGARTTSRQVSASGISALFGNALTAVGFRGGDLRAAVQFAPDGAHSIFGMLRTVAGRNAGKGPKEFGLKSDLVVHACVEKLLGDLAGLVGAEGLERLLAEDAAAGAAAPPAGGDDWRAAAKKSQEAAMAEMTAKQAAFEAMLLEEYSSDEDMEPEERGPAAAAAPPGSPARPSTSAAAAAAHCEDDECCLCRNELHPDEPLGYMGLVQVSNIPELAARKPVTWDEAVASHAARPDQCVRAGTFAGFGYLNPGDARSRESLHEEAGLGGEGLGGEGLGEAGAPGAEPMFPGGDGDLVVPPGKAEEEGAEGRGAPPAADSPRGGAAAFDADALGTLSAVDALPGLHVQTCGHKVHAACLRKYREGLKNRLKGGLTYEGMFLLDVLGDEYLCPVCRRVCNTILCAPAEDGAAAGGRGEGAAEEGAAEEGRAEDDADFAGVVRGADRVLDFRGPSSADAMDVGQDVPSVCTDPAQSVRDPREYALTAQFARTCFETLLKFTGERRSGLFEGLAESLPQRHSGMLWYVLAYNLCHLEVVLRPDGGNGGAGGGAGGGGGRPAGVAHRSHFLAVRQVLQMAVTSTCASEEHQASVKRLLASLTGPDGAAGPDPPLDGAGWVPKMLGALGCMPTASAFGYNAAGGGDAAALRRERLARFVQLDLGQRHFAPPDGSALGVSNRLLEVDPLALLVELLQASTNLTANWEFSGDRGTMMAGAALAFQRILPLVHAVATVQSAVLALCGPGPGGPEGPEGPAAGGPAPGPAEEGEACLEVAQLLRALASQADEAGGAGAWLVEATARHTAPFLRRALLLGHFLEAGSERELLADPLGGTDGAGLAARLRLPPAARVLRDVCEPRLVRRWCAHLVPHLGDVKRHLVGHLAPPLPRPPRPAALLGLPASFQDAIVQWTGKRCKRCKKPDAPKEPAVCLVCGALVCCMEKCCSNYDQIGECTQHAFTCGAGAGVFLLLKQTSLLLVRGSRACIYSSPYLDGHGEEDLGLFRGRALGLNRDRIGAVQAMWRACGFDFDTGVLRLSHGGTRRHGAYSV